ncbi:aspartate/glutamate racemase family protein [Cellulomonas timonensis]|uniref:aspartate/glutamate racemase family protein n=1 Tax=Cellulomonas timonensis TaxID=1689271 RepID=UPI00082A1A4F|nr:amino acid racemase [Cellulomonas timonensis]
MRRIGLLGGTSWQSSAHYYAQLNEGVQARLGGLHSADLVLRSVEFAEIEALQSAGDWAALGERYEREAAQLRAAGAELVGILANTMHLLHDEVARGSGLPVVHVVDVVADAVAELDVERVGVLGTRFTMASDLYPARLAARGVATIMPTGADAAEVDRVIYQELALGRVLDSSRAAYVAIIGRLVEQGAQAIVLGCTELSMLISPDDPTHSPVPVLDSTALHVHALLDAALAPQASSLEEGAA